MNLFSCCDDMSVAYIFNHIFHCIPDIFHIAGVLAAVFHLPHVAASSHQDALA